ncbi:MAG: hypothetical protein HZA22_06545 [Nitrospirae bacterium]|nr:hypothetical protein [Nitrospirota bacterium]
MDLNRLLTLLEEFEGKIAVLYENYAGRFSSDPDVSSVFRDLSTDELTHRDLIRYEKRVVMNDPKHFGNVEADFALVEKMISRVDAALDCCAETTPEDAIALAIEVESSALEGMYKVVPATAEPSFAKLFRAMHDGCSCHVTTVRELAGRREAGESRPDAA